MRAKDIVKTSDDVIVCAGAGSPSNSFLMLGYKKVAAAVLCSVKDFCIYVIIWK